MAQPILLQNTFTRMITDVPPDELPRDACLSIQDFIPNLGLGMTSSEVTGGGRLAKRGGWTYASEDISVDATSAQFITCMGYLGGSINKLCLMTDNNKFGYFIPPATQSDAAVAGGVGFDLVSSSGMQSLQPYVDAFGKLIITNNDGTTALKYYDGTTFGTLGGTPPPAKFAAIWNERLLLANSSASPARVWFSAERDPQTWDTTYGWKDFNRDVTGLAVLPSVLLVFMDTQTARLRGSKPPPSPELAADDPIFQIGCTFPNSIAVNGSNCVFANEEGVFLTNGTSLPQDLTKICGVKNHWQRFMSTKYETGDALTDYDNVYGGFIGNYYLATVHELHAESANTTYAFLFDLTTQSCVTLTNFHADSVAMSPQIGDNLYFGIGTRVVSVNSIFTPGASNKLDANGSGPFPGIVTRYYLDDATFDKRWKTLYMDYALVDAASDNPTLSVEFFPNWQNISGVTTLQTLSETTAAQGTIRAKLPIRKLARGGFFRIAQIGTSSQTILGALYADVYAREGGRVG